MNERNASNARYKIISKFPPQKVQRAATSNYEKVKFQEIKTKVIAAKTKILKSAKSGKGGKNSKNTDFLSFSYVSVCFVICRVKCEWNTRSALQVVYA